jgi:hypothetical protein
MQPQDPNYNKNPALHQEVEAARKKFQALHIVEVVAHTKTKGQYEAMLS